MRQQPMARCSSTASAARGRSCSCCTASRTRRTAGSRRPPRWPRTATAPSRRGCAATTRTPSSRVADTTRSRSPPTRSRSLTRSARTLRFSSATTGGRGICHWTANLHAERLQRDRPDCAASSEPLPQTPRTSWEASPLHPSQDAVGGALDPQGGLQGLDMLYRRWAPDWTGPERDECLANAKSCFADPRCLSGALGYYRASRWQRRPRAIARRPLDHRASLSAGRPT